MSRVCDFRSKQVINVCDGNCLGYVVDVEIDLECGRLTAIVVEGGSRFFGIFNKCEEIVICWEDIQVIGEDSILVCPSKNPYRK